MTTDTRMRLLEREAAQGDQGAADALHRARLRSGMLRMRLFYAGKTRSGERVHLRRMRSRHGTTVPGEHP